MPTQVPTFSGRLLRKRFSDIGGNLHSKEIPGAVISLSDIVRYSPLPAVRFRVASEELSPAMKLLTDPNEVRSNFSIEDFRNGITLEQLCSLCYSHASGIGVNHCSNLFVAKQTKWDSNFVSPFKERLYEF
jgi:hypothetical protein